MKKERLLTFLRRETSIIAAENHQNVFVRTVAVKTSLSGNVLVSAVEMQSHLSTWLR